MLPESLFDTIMEQEPYPSLTYRLDLKTKRIVGFVDGVEAYAQAVDKLLLTERYSSPIYSSSYGVELEGLIGTNIEFAKSDVLRRTQEALEVDDRFVSMENAAIVQEGMNTLFVTAEVTGQDGVIAVDKEVML